RQRGAFQGAGFSRGGRRIVTSSEDRTARVWDAATGEPVTPPLLHNTAVQHAAFSPDGRRVLTAGADVLVRVWDCAVSSSPIPPMRIRGGYMWQASFSPDGRY